MEDEEVEEKQSQIFKGAIALITLLFSCPSLQLILVISRFSVSVFLSFFEVLAPVQSQY